MGPSLWAALFAIISLPFSAGRNFTLQKEIRGNDFFREFWFWSYADPTHGYVDFLSRSQAQSAQLAYVNPAGNFVMQVDNTTVLSNTSQQGRGSVRLHSNDLMGDGILIAKINWMPQGCGTWPAFWTCTTERWPLGGEIDIIEGANDQGPRNLASLHTTTGCKIPGGQGSVLVRNDTGLSSQSDCEYQPGCSVGFSAANSFGPAFNRNGGGYFAMVRDTAPGGVGISVYFWPASTGPGDLPLALQYPALEYLSTTTVNVTSSAYTIQNPLWSTPAAHFPNDPNACPMQNFYSPHSIILDTTLCGDWAGPAFPYAPGCPTNITCEDYVRRNPSAFTDARFEIEYIRVYADANAAIATLPAFLFTTTITALAALFLSL